MDTQVEPQNIRGRQELKRLIRANADLTPAMRVIARFLAEGDEEATTQDQSPENTFWELLSETILARQAKADKPFARILQQDRPLIKAILTDWDKTEVLVGTTTLI